MFEPEYARCRAPRCRGRSRRRGARIILSAAGRRGLASSRVLGQRVRFLDLSHCRNELSVACYGQAVVAGRRHLSSYGRVLHRRPLWNPPL
jgi:hypothetical protein